MRTIVTVLMVLIAATLATLALQAQDEDYTLRIEDADCESGSVEVILDIDFGDGEPLQGYQWGVCHDSDALDLEEEDDIEDGDGLEGLSFTFQSINVLDDGWTIGALFNVVTSETLTPGDDVEFYRVTYNCEDSDLETTEIEFCETLGTPSVAVQVVADDSEFNPVLEAGTITLISQGFLRGDMDNNGTVSALLDALFLMQWAFQDGDAPTCDDAADVNDSGTVQALVDSLAILQWAFLDGDEPPAPGPDECGTDATDDDLECDEMADCD